MQRNIPVARAFQTGSQHLVWNALLLPSSDGVYCDHEIFAESARSMTQPVSLVLKCFDALKVITDDICQHSLPRLRV